MAELSLPESWISSTIGEVVLNTNGARKPISLSLRAEIQGPYPYYGATGQIDSLNNFTHEGEHILIGEDGANLLSKSKDLAFIVNGQFWVNNHAHAVKCVADVPAKYLASYINSLDLTPYVTGSAQPKLTKGNLDKIPVPLPPLAEQKIIAEKLDSLLSQVDNTKARLERIPEILKRFRQSVLAAAVSGKLTEEWRGSNDLNTELDYRELCLNERLSASGKKNIKLAKLQEQPSIYLPESWSWQALDEVNIKITDGTHHSPQSFPDGDYMYVTSKNVREGRIDLGNVTFVDEKTHREIFSRCDVKYGDVLYVKDGANTGLSCVNNITGEFSLLSSVGVLRTCSFMVPSYVQHYLNSPIGRKLMLDLMGGTAIKRLTLTKIAISPVSVPPKKEQTEIVRRVEELFAFADRIEHAAQAALSRVNNLTQSILAKAFRGELTADWRAANPELISGENSAKALLTRIKAERATLSKKTKAKA